MFRKMRRFKQQLTDEECRTILKNELRGVLAINGDDGYPYALPMDYFYDEDNGKIYFHCAKEGAKIDLLRENCKVSFCVHDEGFRKEGEWPLNISSVIVFGRIGFVEDRNLALKEVTGIARKFYPTEESIQAEIEKAFNRVQILELTIDHMTGKLVNES